jgi:NAD-dependent deacetylase
MGAPGEGRIARAAARILSASPAVAALTGAGISVESGIPAFRGSQGLWDRFDPMEYATIEAFRAGPGKVWRMLSAMLETVADAVPNRAHAGLAALERSGRLSSVITQNVDGLHQAAGSERVVEYHGSFRELVCLSCWNRYPLASRWRRGEGPPACDCGEILKPGLVLFGEPIPWGAQAAAEAAVKACGALLVIGTSAQVWPACELPSIAKSHGAAVIEVNTEETPLTRSTTDLFLEGGASEVVSLLMEALP